jgi:hypothetical protein
MLSEDGLWEWDGQSWIAVSASTPSPVSSPTLVSVSQRGDRLDEEVRKNRGIAGYLILIISVLSLVFHATFFGILLLTALITGLVVWRIVAKVSSMIIRQYAIHNFSKDNIIIRFDTERRELNKLRGKEKLFSSVNYCLSPLAVTFFVLVQLMKNSIEGGITDVNEILDVRAALVWAFAPAIASIVLLFKQLQDLELYRATSDKTLTPFGEKINGIIGGALGIGILLPIIQTVWTGGNLESGFSLNSAMIMLWIWILLFFTLVAPMLIASYVHINVHRSIVNRLRDEIIHLTESRPHDFEYIKEKQALSIVVSDDPDEK